MSVSDCVQPVETETFAYSWGRLSACWYVCSSMSLAHLAYLVSAEAPGKPPAQAWPWNRALQGVPGLEEF